MDTKTPPGISFRHHWWKLTWLGSKSLQMSFGTTPRPTWRQALPLTLETPSCHGGVAGVFEKASPPSRPSEAVARGARRGAPRGVTRAA